MIQLTKLDGQTIAINAAFILTAETTPDTVLTLSVGQKMIVKESVAEIVGRIAELARAAHG